jgi:hypothetical protein
MTGKEDIAVHQEQGSTVGSHERLCMMLRRQVQLTVSDLAGVAAFSSAFASSALALGCGVASLAFGVPAAQGHAKHAQHHAHRPQVQDISESP